jgi:choline dehydrogenase
MKERGLPLDRYDYVIVGAGSSGCALAYKLSANPDVTVALLEAGGPDEHPDIHHPQVYFSLWGTEVDWAYSTVPQKNTGYRIHPWPRGKVLGGTSSINGMVFLRGSRHDYDAWAYEGNVGWDYAGVLPCFRDMETSGLGSSEYHGTSGPLHVAVPSDLNPMSEVFIDACVEAGYQRNQDFNGEILEGAGWNELSIYEGKRMSAARAFLRPAMSRPNLTVITGAWAHRLTIERPNRVVGVQYVSDGSPGEISAEREVILSCGAVDSPRLLMLSGIGPAAELEDLGIEVVADVPGVGKNLHDHLLIGVVYASTRPSPPNYAHITESCLFAKSDPRLLSPDIEISFNKEAHFAEGYDVPPDCFTLIPGIVRPQSRGWLRLSSASPLDPPIINPRYLSVQADVVGLLRGIEMCRDIGMTNALKPWRRHEVVPGPAAIDEKALRRYIAGTVSTWFHPVGSCKMGIGEDAVVDPELRVRDITGLRVADASIMPQIVSANTNGAAMMIGWKAGEIILGDARASAGGESAKAAAHTAVGAAESTR